jgi:hypothetical protein
MKLGTETGSVINHLMSRSTRDQATPEVGMGATVLMWTDRRAATVTRVWVERKATLIRVQYDEEQPDGSFAHNPNGGTDTFRQANIGGWEQVTKNSDTGRYNKVEGGGWGLMLGVRQSYRDPSF